MEHKEKKTTPKGKRVEETLYHLPTHEKLTLLGFGNAAVYAGIPLLGLMTSVVTLVPHTFDDAKSPFSNFMRKATGKKPAGQPGSAKK